MWLGGLLFGCCVVVIFGGVLVDCVKVGGSVVSVMNVSSV